MKDSLGVLMQRSPASLDYSLHTSLQRVGHIHFVYTITCMCAPRDHNVNYMYSHVTHMYLLILVVLLWLNLVGYMYSLPTSFKQPLSWLLWPHHELHVHVYTCVCVPHIPRKCGTYVPRLLGICAFYRMCYAI